MVGDWVFKNVTAAWILAMALIGVGSYLWITTGDVPDTLVNLLSIIIAFYFGETTGKLQEVNKSLREEC